MILQHRTVKRSAAWVLPAATPMLALAKSMVVENQPGGGGSIGANETAKSMPDGYAWGIAAGSTTTANPPMNPKSHCNSVTDFTPNSNVAATLPVIAVHPSIPSKAYKGFLVELKKQPGKFSFASSGAGGIRRLQLALFQRLSGTFVTHMPYRGAGPALNDTVAGQVPINFNSLAEVHAGIEGAGALIVANSPAEFGAQLKAAFEVYKQVVENQPLKRERAGRFRARRSGQQACDAPRQA